MAMVNKKLELCRTLVRSSMELHELTESLSLFPDEPLDLLKAATSLERAAGELLRMAAAFRQAMAPPAPSSPTAN